MMTPQEVSQHAFAKASFGGYNMAMVDEFLDALTVDYTALYVENAKLKTRMKTLAEKLEEYRSTDEGMRKAFLLAQKAADDIIAQAERQKAELMKTAEREARAKIDGLRQELENEQLRLSSAQAATAAYVASLQQLYEQQVQYLANLSAIHAAPPSAVATAAQELETSMERIVAEETPEPDPKDELDTDPELEDQEMPAEAPSDGGLYAEIMELNIKPRTAASAGAEQIADGLDAFSEDAAEDPDNTSPTRRIDFNNLKFGRDYEIK